VDTSRRGLGEEERVRLYPRIGAHLNGGPADAAVLRYLAVLAEKGEAESVHAIAAPEQDGIAGADLAGRVAAELREAGGARLAERLEPEFHETGDAGAILRFIRERDLDLIVLGRRIPSHQLDHAELYPRLVGRSPCDVLLVTPFSPARFDRVLVPTDFSRHARLALGAGARLARACGSSAGTITCHNVFEVPYGYAYSGRSMSQFAGEQRAHAERAFADFVKGNEAGGIPVRCEYTPAHSVADAVVELALAIQADLVAVGSRGRTAAAALLVGSIAVKVLEKCAAPMLIVKEKGETLGLLDALLPH
jgi:nucleotide-binding universal stress UspA family protein